MRLRRIEVFAEKSQNGTAAPRDGVRFETVTLNQIFTKAPLYSGYFSSVIVGNK